MDTFKEMSLDEWFDTYKPLKNHLDINSSFDGTMYETYGDEVEWVKQQAPHHIWMYGQGDDGGTYIWNGWHFVNRIGYFVTEVGCPDNTTIQVLVSEPLYECPTCGAEWEGESAELMEETLGQIDKCTGCATMDEIKEYER